MYITITFDAAMPTLIVRDSHGYTIKEDFFPSHFTAMDWMDDIAEQHNIEWDITPDYYGRVHKAHTKLPESAIIPKVDAIF